MKSWMIIFALVLPLGAHAQMKFREVFCEVKLANKLMDKTIFYLRPGQKVSARMSILNGTDEIIVTVDHNMRGKSQIIIRDYHGGVKSKRDQLNKHTEKVKMKDMVNKQVKMVFRPNKLKKQLNVNCKRIK